MSPHTGTLPLVRMGAEVRVAGEWCEMEGGLGLWVRGGGGGGSGGH